MSVLKLSKYNSFINTDCIKLIQGEFLGVIFLIVCMGGLVPAVFDSDRWVINFFDYHMSLYYFYPVFVGFLGLIYLFRNFFKFYRHTIFNFCSKDSSIVFNICWFKNIQSKNFGIIIAKHRIGHWNGFKKEYFNCVGIKINNKVYLIPVEEDKQDELVQLLLDNGGSLV